MAGLGAGHAGFYRTRELPRSARRYPALAGIGQLGGPAGDSGLGDPQAIRIMVQAGKMSQPSKAAGRRPADPSPRVAELGAGDIV